MDGGAEANIGPAVTTVPSRGAPARGRIAGVAPRRLLVYLPILPALFAFVVLLGYPVVLVVAISFQKMGLRELVQHTTVWIGLDNYRHDLHRPDVLDDHRPDVRVHASSTSP